VGERWGLKPRTTLKDGTHGKLTRSGGGESRRAIGTSSGVMFLPMRRFGFIVLWVVRLPWLGLGHARLEMVLSCGYRLGGEASAP